VIFVLQWWAWPIWTVEWLPCQKCNVV